jgi:hypothetical protein
MAAIQSFGNDAESDYGSDFTADEELELNELLSKVPVPIDRRPQFEYTDIEDHEFSPTPVPAAQSTRSARFPSDAIPEGNAVEKGILSIALHSNCGITSEAGV